MSHNIIPKENPVYQYTAELLAALSKSGRGLQELLEIGYKIFGNPLVVADKSWKVIAMTPQIEIPGDKSWNEFLTNGFGSPETVESGIKDKLIQKIDTSPTPFRWLSNDMKYPRLFSKIMLNDKIPAVISIVEYNKPFVDSDYELIKILCDALSAEFQKNEYHQFTRGTQHEDIFINILEGRFRDLKSITERLNVLQIVMRKNIYVFVCDVKDCEARQISVDYLRYTLEEMIIVGKSLIYNGFIVFVASFNDETTIDRIDEELGAFLNRFGILIGVSRSFEQLELLRLHYEQAVNALRVGRHMDVPKPLYFYDECAIYHVAKVFWDSGWTENFIHPALEKLIHYDRDSNNELILTLCTYIRNFGNITNMSKEMNMHRNTAIYRIQRIEEIMNVSISDYKTMEQIIFSLRLMEYNKKVEYTPID